jgi:hypothetical protein
LLLIAIVLMPLPQANAADGYNQQISAITADISQAILQAGKKKVTVLNFTDLEGNTSELGRFLAEEISVGLVIKKKDFSVLDRANLIVALHFDGRKEAAKKRLQSLKSAGLIAARPRRAFEPGVWFPKGQTCPFYPSNPSVGEPVHGA